MRSLYCGWFRYLSEAGHEIPSTAIRALRHQVLGLSLFLIDLILSTRLAVRSSGELELASEPQTLARPDPRGYLAAAKLKSGPDFLLGEGCFSLNVWSTAELKEVRSWAKGQSA